MLNYKLLSMNNKNSSNISLFKEWSGSFFNGGGIGGMFKGENPPVFVQTETGQKDNLRHSWTPFNDT